MKEIYKNLEEAITLELHRQGMSFQIIPVIMQSLKTEKQQLQFGEYLSSIQDKEKTESEVLTKALLIANEDI